MTTNSVARWRGFGPRSIRDASTLFAFGDSGASDFEDHEIYMPADKVRMVDIGDADMVHTNTEKCHDYLDRAGRLLGFALNGRATAERAALTRLLPAILP